MLLKAFPCVHSLKLRLKIVHSVTHNPIEDISTFHVLENLAPKIEALVLELAAQVVGTVWLHTIWTSVSRPQCVAMIEDVRKRIMKKGDGGGKRVRFTGRYMSLDEVMIEHAVRNGQIWWDGERWAGGNGEEGGDVFLYEKSSIGIER